MAAYFVKWAILAGLERLPYLWVPDPAHWDILMRLCETVMPYVVFLFAFAPWLRRACRALMRRAMAQPPDVPGDGH